MMIIIIGSSKTQRGDDVIAEILVKVQLANFD